MSIDPTRIKIDVDPRSQRMVGVSAHGLKPFDVPFISEIVPDLWLGGCEDGLVLPDFIENLVSLYPWESYTVNHELDSSLEVRMYDSLDQVFHHVDSIATWVNACRGFRSHPGALPGRAQPVQPGGRPRLVLDGMDVDAAITLVREKRPKSACATRHSSAGCARAAL